MEYHEASNSESLLIIIFNILLEYLVFVILVYC